MEDKTKENLLKVIRIGTAHTLKGSLMKEIPKVEDNTESVYTIKKMRWYHYYFSPREIKLMILKWWYGRKGLCTCDCHFVDGFFHCWTGPCCEKHDRKHRRIKWIKNR